jgi:(2Fe-2S) ferredoxin
MFASTTATVRARLAATVAARTLRRSEENRQGHDLKGKLRVARRGCMDVCAFGPNIMIWPEGLWYMKVTKEDIPQIVQTYMKLEEADKQKRKPPRQNSQLASQQSSP